MAHCCSKVSSYKQDSVWSWFICLSTTTCMILTFGFSFALGVLLPVFMDSFKETREKAAWVLSIAFGVATFLGPITGGFLNRFGLRITTILGCLFCSVGMAAGSFAPSIVILYIAFSLPFAVGMSLVYVTSTIIVTHYFTKRRSLALGLVTAGQGLGQMILGPTLQALVDVFDWRKTFRVFAGIVAVASLNGCLLRERTTSNERLNTPHKKFRLNLSLLKEPTIVILLSTIPFFATSRIVPHVHLIKFCNDLGITDGKGSTLYLFVGIFGTLGRLGGGFLCDVKYVNTIRLFQAGTFIMGASTMLLSLAQTYAALALYAIVFSMADGILLSTFIVECMEVVDEESKRASLIGLIIVCGAGFLLGAPPLFGLMADKFGNYIAAFLIAGGFGIIASIIPFFLLCVPRESKEYADHDIELEVDQVQDEVQDAVDEYELKPRSFSQISTIVNRGDRQRKTSFIMAMEKPFY